MKSVVCSPMDCVDVDGITVVGERINPTGKKRFQQALREGDMNYVLEQAVSQTEAGAQILDVNVGAPGVDEPALMEQVVKALQSVVSLPLQLDSSHAEALERGLRVYNGKPIVNSVNGEEEKLNTILPLCKKYGAAVVGLAIDERGILPKAEDRVAIARRIKKAALEAAANQPGWTTKDLTANLTRVRWTVKSPDTEIPQTTPIENGETVDLSKNEWSRKDGNDGTVDFTHGGTTYEGMTLDTDDEAGTKTYKKTEDNGTVTIITVTTRQLTEDEIKAKFDGKFGEGKYERDAAKRTVTYTGEDGKTYTASYVAQEEKLTVEVQKPDAVAGTGSTKEEAENAFHAKLDEARKKS